jgi:hypothetical protein
MSSTLCPNTAHACALAQGRRRGLGNKAMSYGYGRPHSRGTLRQRSRFLGRLCKPGDLRIRFDSRGSCLFPSSLASERSPHARALDAIVDENHGCVSGLAPVRFGISVAVAHMPTVRIIRRVDVGKCTRWPADRPTHADFSLLEMAPVNHIAAV